LTKTLKLFSVRTFGARKLFVVGALAPAGQNSRFVVPSHRAPAPSQSMPNNLTVMNQSIERCILWSIRNIAARKGCNQRWIAKQSATKPW